LRWPSFKFTEEVATNILLTPLQGGISKPSFARIIFLLISTFFPTTVLFAQTNTFDTPSLAFLSVVSSQEGSSVLIDSKEIGATPLRQFPVSAGQHEIIVRSSQAMSWLDEDWQERVTLSAGDTLTLVARLVRGYRINSVPYGAQVWWEDKLLGTTPYVLRLPENQTARLEIRRPSYLPVQIEIGGPESVTPQRRSHDIVLTRNFDYAALQQHEVAQRRARAGKYRKLAYLSTAIGMASGISSVLLKREADKAYEQYLVVGDPILRENYFDRAEKYDRYYSATFAAFEVSFGVSFYGFLKALKK